MSAHRVASVRTPEPLFLRRACWPARLAALVTAGLVAGCAVQPTTGTRLTTHSVLSEDRSVLLVVDLCVNFSPLAGSDYFVVDPARQSADAMVAGVRQYLALHGVKVGTAVTPFICGALHDEGNAPKKVATAIDGEIADRPQPLWWAPPVAADPAYGAALLDLATHSYQGALARTEGVSTASPPKLFIDEGRARRAMQVIRERSGHATLIYVGVTGSSLSAEKATAFNTLRFVGALALSVAVGPIAVGAGYGIQPVFVAGPVRDNTQMAAALVDLRETRVARTRVIHTNGDPLKAEALVHPEGLGLLLRDITLTSSRTVTP